MKWFAHKMTGKNGKDYFQPLEEHLANVSEHCMNIGVNIGLKYSSYCIGLLHDLGKSSKLFADYIVNNKNIHVNHSSAGGMYIYNTLMRSDKIEDVIPGEIMAYVIFAHHGLFDMINSTVDELNFSKRLHFNKNNEYDEKDYEQFINEALEPVVNKRINMTLDELIYRSSLEIQEILKKCNELAIKTAKDIGLRRKAMYYYWGLIVRLLLSILKEGDIYDSSNVFLTNKNPVIPKKELEKLWSEGVDSIEEQYEGFAKLEEKGSLDEVRTFLSEEAKRKAGLIKSGCIKAELPTGAGKTLLATRFAVHNCGKFKKKKFIYITSFLSVLEQNAKEIKKIFKNDPRILEHHSNVVHESMTDSQQDENDKDNQKYYLNQYLIESWEAPIILTTMVQFMNTLFKGKASNIRRFCKLIDSVIVMDEIQNIPIKIINNFNLMNNFLTEIMNVTTIHLTATQPELDSNSLEFKIIYPESENENLALLPEEMGEIFKRVRAFYLSKMSYEDLFNHVDDQVQDNNSILVIANTKKTVHTIYQEMKRYTNIGFKVYELTTNQCAIHRLKKIEKIKKELKNNERVILVSTQLVEAGVNLDFNIVYRTMAGISSLIQAMGRCNREGKLEYGVFYILKLEGENLGSLQDIKKEQMRAEMCLSGCENYEISIDSVKKRYFDSLYENNKDKFYNIKLNEEDTNLLEILSDNNSLVNERKQMNKENPYTINQNFKTASNAFQMIEDSGDSVVVTMSENFGNLSNIELIEEYRESVANLDYKKAKGILKKLQPYTININNIIQYERNLEVVNDTYILLEHFYDDEVGLNDNDLETLIF